ncbi:hypothetical protein HAX54_036467 [Datura stramonium]|uniref:Uncharacterized protein n=1 Tax=Datura stramonium TaxID=4076 RepID=A0ABS8VHS3_DATST|nr:hypothetical protein [Datura stramonium]
MKHLHAPKPNVSNHLSIGERSKGHCVLLILELATNIVGLIEGNSIIAVEHTNDDAQRQCTEIQRPRRGFPVRGRERRRAALAFDINNEDDLVKKSIRLPSSKATRCKSGFLREPNDRFELVASCGDLILLSSGENYCICNILTRQWIALPPAPSGRNFGEPWSSLYEPLDE